MPGELPGPRAADTAHAPPAAAAWPPPWKSSADHPPPLHPPSFPQCPDRMRWETLIVDRINLYR